MSFEQKIGIIRSSLAYAQIYFVCDYASDVYFALSLPTLYMAGCYGLLIWELPTFMMPYLTAIIH